jgi:hypothetical protein
MPIKRAAIDSYCVEAYRVPDLDIPYTLSFVVPLRPHFSRIPFLPSTLDSADPDDKDSVTLLWLR